jgi:uncharacterized protein YdeI (BOF family)
MKRILATIFIAFLFLSGCSTEQYGAGINKSAPAVKVKDVILNPSLQRQTVNLEGIIITQCQGDGCWFFLNDGTGRIFIDLKPSGIKIPPKTGKKAKVTGVVVNEGGNYMVIGHGVEIN